ncbi:MAG: MFS transporter [Brevundimonas sp.]|nr:MFS transporter [Brevundimonas sp.]
MGVSLMGAAGDLKERFVTGYGVGSFATGLYSTVPSVLLLFYCTEILRIAPAAAGLVILIPKLWSLLWDPLVGGWLDRSRRHMAAMKAGAFGLIAAFTALFSTPVLSEEMVVVWVACSYFLLTTLYSLFAVPYTAYPALITSCREDRVRLISRRMMFVMLGVFCGASAAPFIIEATGGGRFGYSSMATILAAICVLAMTTALASIRSGPPFRETYPVEADLPSERPVALLIQNRKFLWLSISFILQLSAVGGLMAMIPYIVTIDFARSEGEVGTSLAIMIGVTIISVPIWARIARQLGDRGALRLASFLYAVSSVLIACSYLILQNWYLFCLSLPVCGFSFAGLQVLPFTAVAHIINNTSRSSGAFLNGVWTSLEKSGLAVGAALGAAALSVFERKEPHISAYFVLVVPTALCIMAIFLIPKMAGALSEDPKDLAPSV